MAQAVHTYLLPILVDVEPAVDVLLDPPYPPYDEYPFDPPPPTFSLKTLPLLLDVSYSLGWNSIFPVPTAQVIQSEKLEPQY